MIEWTLKKLEIKNLKEHPKNPREITKDHQRHLENLIETFNLIEKPIVNMDMTIIGGHQRIKILKKMKTKSVQCWVPDRLLNEEEVDHLCIGLNLNQGQWDWDVLGNSWEPLNLLQYGFSESQILGLHEDSPKPKKNSKNKVKTCPSCGHEL